MRIGIDGQCLFGGRGPARYLRNILNALVSLDNKNQYFVFVPLTSGKNSAVVLQSCSYAVQMSLNDNGRLPLCRKIDKRAKVVASGIRPWLSMALPILVKKYGIDLLFFPASDFWVWKRCKTVVTILDIVPYIFLEQFSPKKIDRIYERMHKKSLKRLADTIITISEFSKKSIITNLNIPGENINVIYCGVDPIFFSEQRYELNEQSPYLLFVGGFDFRKNLENLIIAFKKLKENGFTHKLIIAGAPSNYGKIGVDVENLVKKNEVKDVEIKINPSDLELVSLYKNASALVIPSIIEGFGLPVIEAFACGCPVVSSNAGALPEVGGDAVIYFNPYDILDIQEKMEKVLSDEGLRKSMIEKGKMRMKEFRWEVAAKKLLGVFERVMK